MLKKYTGPQKSAAKNAQQEEKQVPKPAASPTRTTKQDNG